METGFVAVIISCNVTNYPVPHVLKLQQPFYNFWWFCELPGQSYCWSHFDSVIPTAFRWSLDPDGNSNKTALPWPACCLGFRSLPDDPSWFVRASSQASPDSRGKETGPSSSWIEQNIYKEVKNWSEPSLEMIEHNWSCSLVRNGGHLQWVMYVK